MILKELGFEVHKIIFDTPQKLMFSYLKSFHISNIVASSAFNYLNDSFRLPLCCFYPPQHLAVSAIYLAMRKLSFPMPKKPWWVLAECSFNSVQKIAAQMLNLYKINKYSFENINKIMLNSLNIKGILKMF